MAWVDVHGNGYRGVYRAPTGAKTKTKTYKSRKLALQAAQDEEARLRSGTWFDPGAGRVTFADYFESQWYPNRQGERRTKDEYWYAYNASLKDEFGSLELRKILPSTVQGWINRMMDDEVGPNTIHARFKVLQTCLAARKGVSARRDRLIQYNPCEGTQLPVIPEREVTILEPDQVDKILLALDPWWRLLPLLLSETGLRWGEAMGLTVDSFTLDFRCLFVRRTIIETKVEHTGNGTRFMWKPYPKTKKPRRVSLARQVSTAVQELVVERQLSGADRLFSMPDKTPPGEWHPPHTLVWTTKRTDAWPEGLPIAATFHRRIWARALTTAGAPHRTVRDLRASHISWLLAGQADLPTVMERVGHTRFATTRKYTSVLSDADDRALEALERLKSRYEG